MISVRELCSTITLTQIEQMIDDCKRTFLGSELHPIGSKEALPDAEKFLNVRRMLFMAHLAAKKGEHDRCQFMLGMAAGFYGLIRLAEAQDLEKELGHGLGMSVPKKKKHKSAGTAASKEISVNEIQTQFRFEDMVGFLSADGVNFMADEQKGVIVVGFNGEHGPVHLMARVNEQRKVLFLLFRLPLAVPEERRVEMSEATTRANYGLSIGCFEMDLRNGELNFKVSVPTDEATLSLSQFRRCMGAAGSTIDYYMPAFFQVVFNDMSAEEAIDKCGDE